MEKNDFVITEFVGRSHELNTAIRRQSSGLLIEPYISTKFSLELNNYHLLLTVAVFRFPEGLGGDESKKRLERDGSNSIVKSTELGIWAKFFLAFVGGFSPLLWLSCFFVFLSWRPFGSPPSNNFNLALAIALLLVIVISGLFQFYQQYSSSKVLEGFKTLLPPLCIITRDGSDQQAAPADLVVGDIVTLQVGMRVPADMRILAGINLRMDKSLLTGETNPICLISTNEEPTVHMLESRNMAFMGCNIVEGEGKGIVIATGKHNQLCKIVAQVAGVKGKASTLQTDINRFVSIIAVASLSTVAVVVLQWAFYLRVNHAGFMTPSSMIANAVGVLVAFVPEGLPLALSMGLTIIASRLCVVHHVLVKQLLTIETLGSMSNLATDKTGTLTTNVMTVTSFISASDCYPASKVTLNHAHAKAHPTVRPNARLTVEGSEVAATIKAVDTSVPDLHVLSEPGATKAPLLIAGVSSFSSSASSSAQPSGAAPAVGLHEGDLLLTEVLFCALRIAVLCNQAKLESKESVCDRSDSSGSITTRHIILSPLAPLDTTEEAGNSLPPITTTTTATQIAQSAAAVSAAAERKNSSVDSDVDVAGTIRLRRKSSALAGRHPATDRSRSGHGHCHNHGDGHGRWRSKPAAGPRRGKGPLRVVGGNGIDKALLHWALSNDAVKYFSVQQHPYGPDQQSYRPAQTHHIHAHQGPTSLGSYHIEAVLPFTSAAQMSAVVVSKDVPAVGLGSQREQQSSDPAGQSTPGHKHSLSSSDLLSQLNAEKASSSSPPSSSCAIVDSQKLQLTVTVPLQQPHLHQQQHSNLHRRYLVLVKGAPEAILARCDFYLADDAGNHLYADGENEGDKEGEKEVGNRVQRDQQGGLLSHQQHQQQEQQEMKQAPATDEHEDGNAPNAYDGDVDEEVDDDAAEEQKADSVAESVEDLKCSAAHSRPLTAHIRQRIAHMVECRASEGERVVALAHYAIPAQFVNKERLKKAHANFISVSTSGGGPAGIFSSDPQPNFPLTGLTFVACVSVSDPPREGVREAVEALRAAGVHVAMVTGDAPTTGKAIAQQVGIISADSVETDVFSDWWQQEQAREREREWRRREKERERDWQQVWDHPAVFSSPSGAIPPSAATAAAAAAAVSGEGDDIEEAIRQADGDDDDRDGDKTGNSLYADEWQLGKRIERRAGVYFKDSTPPIEIKPKLLVDCSAAGVVENIEESLEGSTSSTSSSCKGSARGYSRSLVVIARDLDSITPKGWRYIMRHEEVVFARMTPAHKLLVVSEYQRLKAIVGVTGDGVNDSPALKKADIGIAMQSGSDVARDAADMVLLRDDFTSIVDGVEEGRLIFNNLRKVIGYQIAAGCWAELLPVLATFFLGMPQPLSAFHMIIISTITDVYAGVALTREPSEHFIMHEPPRDPSKQYLVDLTLVAYSYLIVGNLESVIAFFIYFLYMSNRGPSTGLPRNLPADDDGQRQFPTAYEPHQLIGAWNWGANPNSRLGQDQAAAASVGSSVFVTALTVCQYAHLISIRRKSPYFCDAILDSEGVGGNVFFRLWSELKASRPRVPIVAAIIMSAITMVIVNEVPLIQRYCGTGHVPSRYWGIALGFSMALFLLLECRKWVIYMYPQSLMSKVLFAW